MDVVLLRPTSLRVSEKMMTPQITLPADGQTLRAFGEEVRILLNGEQTGGKFTLFHETTPPGGGPPPHYHSVEDEVFYVLEGRAAFFKDGAWTEVPVGSTVFMPKNVVHCFKNVGDVPMKMVIQTLPSGFEIFFARCAAECAKPGAPDMARLMAIAAEHGIHFVG